MARVTTVESARKSPGTCGRCGVTINVGDSYQWAALRLGRSSQRKVRCAASACRLRPSDLTSSDKLSRVYAAQEAAEDAIDGWEPDASETEPDEVKEALEAMAEEIRETAQEYRDSADNIREAFTGGSATADECEEKADNLEAWADEVENAQLESFEAEGHAPEDLEEAHATWVTEVKDAAQEAVGNCPV